MIIFLSFFLLDITITWSDVINIWGCIMIDGERLRYLATCIKSTDMWYLDEWIVMQLLSTECIEWILDDVINTCRAFRGPQTLWSQKYRENWWVGIFIYIFWHLSLLTTFTHYFKGFLCTLKIKHNNWELGVDCVWYLLYIEWVDFREPLRETAMSLTWLEETFFCRWFYNQLILPTISLGHILCPATWKK